LRPGLRRTNIALKAIEEVAKKGKAPEDVSSAVRKAALRHHRRIAFDQGRPKKAQYFVLQVASDDPQVGDNKK
jgi:hypothetical protein